MTDKQIKSATKKIVKVLINKGIDFEVQNGRVYVSCNSDNEDYAFRFYTIISGKELLVSCEDDRMSCSLAKKESFDKFVDRIKIVKF